MSNNSFDADFTSQQLFDLTFDLQLIGKKIVANIKNSILFLIGHKMHNPI